jgi:hypothetical protein
MRELAAFTLALSLSPLLLTTNAFADDKGKRCTKTSVSCYDAKNKQARTCVTETCTFADGHTTTSVTVEMLGGTGGGTRKPIGKVQSRVMQKAE